MTDIYLDPSAAASADAAAQLRHLTDTGHRVLVLGELPETLVGASFVSVGATIPSAPPPGSWLITANAERCSDRRPHMQTMLLGPKPAPTPRPLPCCDTEARDLAHAVLEILRHEAMG